MGAEQATVVDAPVWVRAFHAKAGKWKAVGGAQPRLCRECADRKGTPECKEVVTSFLQTPLQSALVCHECALKQAIARLDDTTAVMATVRSTVMDPPHLWQVARSQRSSYRHFREMWAEVPSVSEETIELLARAVDARRARGVSSLRALVKSYYEQTPGGSPGLFSSDVSIYSTLREACASMEPGCESRAPADRMRVRTVGDRDVTRWYRVLRGDSARKVAKCPISSYLTSELRDDSQDICAHLYQSLYRFGEKVTKLPYRGGGQRAELFVADGKTPSLLVDTANCSLTYSGQAWVEKLSTVARQEDAATLRKYLRIGADSLFSADASPERTQVARGLDLLELLLGERETIPERAKKVISRFLGSYRDLKANGSRFDTAVRELARGFDSLDERTVAGMSRGSYPGQVMAETWRVPDAADPVALLTDMLDIVALTDDEMREDTPIVVRGYSGLRGQTVKGYVRPPLPEVEEHDFGYSDLRGWEVEGDRVYASLDPAQGGNRLLHLRIGVCGGARLRLRSRLAAYGQSWQDQGGQ